MQVSQAIESLRNIAMKQFFIALTTTLVLGGCASPLVSLNDPSRSFIAPDLANLLKPREIPYEIKEIEGVEVGYNLMFSNDENMQGYRLTLVFRNKTKEPRELAPVVTLEDGGRLQVPAYSYDAFVANGAVLAGTQVPSIPLEQLSS